MDTVSSRSGIHTVGWIATVLVIIGAINWLLVGLFNFNVLGAIFGMTSWFTRLLYVLVGISGLYMIYFARELSREAHGEAVVPPRHHRQHPV